MKSSAYLCICTTNLPASHRSILTTAPLNVTTSDSSAARAPSCYASFVRLRHAQKFHRIGLPNYRTRAALVLILSTVNVVRTWRGEANVKEDDVSQICVAVERFAQWPRSFRSQKKPFNWSLFAFFPKHDFPSASVQQRKP